MDRIFPPRAVVDTIQARYPAGTRIRVLACSDPYTRLRAGTEGTVTFVDATGTVHARWDDASTLGMVHGEDLFEVVRPR